MDPRVFGEALFPKSGSAGRYVLPTPVGDALLEKYFEQDGIIL